MKKHIMIGVLLLAVVGVGLVSTSHVFAQDRDGQTTLVQKIATKFGLKQDDVQAVFDQHKDEHHAMMEEKFAARLDQLVKAGKITDAQKQLIINKHKEMKASMESKRETFKDMSPEERKSAMESERQALDAWAKENGIDRIGKGMMHKHFMGK